MKQFLVAFLFCLLPFVCFADEEQERIDRLVEALGAREFAVREQAQQELVEIGVPAIDELQEALNNDDPEVAVRAAEALRQIRENDETGILERVLPELPQGLPGPDFELPELPELPNLPDLRPDMPEIPALPNLPDFPQIPNLPDINDPTIRTILGVLKLQYPQLAPALDLLEQILRNMPKIEISDIEKDLHVRLQPVSEALQSHLQINNGLIVSNSDEQTFFEEHDIILTVTQGNANFTIESVEDLNILYTADSEILILREGGLVELTLEKLNRSF